MDFKDTPEEAEFRVKARTFLSANATAKKDALDRNLATGADRDKHLTAGRDWQAKKHAGGFAGLTWPKEYGGQELPPICQVIYNQEESTYVVPRGIYEIGLGMCIPTMMAYATEEQKQRYAPAALSGEEIWCQLFSENSAGSDLAGLRMKAQRDGDEWLLNGEKIWTSGAHYCDFGIIVARSNPDVAKHKGISALMIETDSPGMTRRPFPDLTGGDPDFNEVFFDGVRVPAANLIGEEGRGFRYILDGMNAERILIAAECLGDARWFIETARNYASERRVFGRPIGQNQGVQFPIARAFAQTEAAELMVRRAAGLYEAGVSCGPEANMAKLLAADASWAAAEACLQTHGGYGFAEEFDVERKFRETRLYQIAPISTNLILAYLAEHVLDLPRSY